MWDTEYEKSIGLGSTYPYEPLAKGECLVPAGYQAEGLKVGDILTIDNGGGEDWPSLWHYIARSYNKRAKEEGWTAVNVPEKGP